jgi:hypothetical protein
MPYYCSYAKRDCWYPTNCQTCADYALFWRIKTAKMLNKITINFECPDCHGKFNQAVLKWLIPPQPEDNTGITGKSGYVCPFYGKEMVGLK